MSLRDRVADVARTALHSRKAIEVRFPDVDKAALDIFHRVKPFTMTSPERVLGLCDAVRYVVAANIPGAFVECGVWKGGSSMAAALAFTAAGDRSRDMWLFDTFDGMTEPTEHDRQGLDGPDAAQLLNSSTKSDRIWCYSPLDEVRQNLASTGYPEQQIHLIQGPVEETLPGQSPGQIALLRLDTDWYESTRHELVHLFPLLSPGGVLIVDDYGAWAGARKAVDEYFAEIGRPMLFTRLDFTGRIGVKTAG